MPQILYSTCTPTSNLKEKGKLYLSIDRIIDRTLAATGIRSRTTLNKVILPRINKSISAQSNVSTSNAPTVLDSLSLRPKIRKLDKFNQDLLRKTIFDLHREKIVPTLQKILDRVEDSIVISRTSLAIALNEMGFSFRKRGKKHYAKENPQIISDSCYFLRKIR